MRGANAVVHLEVLVEHLRIGRVHDVVTIGLWQSGECADTAAGEDDVAMAFGVRHAPLVGIGWIETAGQAEGVGGFLREPPGVLAVAAVVVIAAAEPVHGGDIDSIAPHVFERSVVAAVAADFGVAVEFTADDLQVLAVDIRPVGADTFQVGPLLLTCFAGLSTGIGLDLGGNQRGRLGIAAYLEPTDIQIVFEWIFAREDAEGVGAALADVSILAVITGMSNENAAIG